MPVFAYRAVDGSGKRSRGQVSGATAAAVSLDLERSGLLPIEVQEVKLDSSRPAGFGSRRGVLEFTRGTAALLSAGMPLVRALNAAASTAPDSIRPSLDAVKAKVERGDELAAALMDHPRLFTPLYVGIVRAGEKSGALTEAFERLTNYLERDQELRSKLVSMSIYPALLAVVGMGAILVLVLFVLPRFAELLTNTGAALPKATAFILGVSTQARQSWRLIVLAIVGVILLIAWFRTTKGGRTAAARIAVVLPVVGHWRRQALAAAFARMVGELLHGGAPLLSALSDARDCMTDPTAQAETDRIRKQIREGVSLHGAIATGGMFPPVLGQLVALGEESGRLSDFLLKAADLLERRTERAVERMVALAEPAMIVMFGGVVAVVALALLQAIYGVNAGSFR